MPAEADCVVRNRVYVGKIGNFNFKNEPVIVVIGSSAETILLLVPLPCCVVGFSAFIAS